MWLTLTCFLYNAEKREIYLKKILLKFLLKFQRKSSKYFTARAFLSSLLYTERKCGLQG